MALDSPKRFILKNGYNWKRTGDRCWTEPFKTSRYSYKKLGLCRAFWSTFIHCGRNLLRLVSLFLHKVAAMYNNPDSASCFYAGWRTVFYTCASCRNGLWIASCTLHPHPGKKIHCFWWSLVRLARVLSKIDEIGHGILCMLDGFWNWLSKFNQHYCFN